VVIDDALGALDEDGLRRVVQIFETELSRTGVLHMGRAMQGRDPLFDRVVHLVRDDGAPAPESAS
jgi:ABC-type uncharacterized transport system fused permease/ATPase subunit